jgi:hypothetical protein
MSEKVMNYEQAYKYLKTDVEELIDNFEEKMENFYDPREYHDKLQVLHNIKNQMETYDKMVDSKLEINKDYKLKGWDWAELADKLNIKIEEPEVESYAFSIEENDFLYYKAVQNYLKANSQNEEVINILKDHLRAMLGEELNTSGSYNEVWAAMLKIKYDDVFMQFVFALLPHMWT